MTIQEAIAYIEAHTWSQWKLGLSRTVELLEKLGNPQKNLCFVHVAGSNGKGSTCAMIERILREAGYRTGLYPSPHIEEFRERIQMNGTCIPEDALCELTARVKEVADAMEDHPTQFELITAIGMLFFAEQHCDIVVLEVGLGGAFDSTNVIDAPEVCVITNIGLDHTEYLGDTLPKITEAKCGIIKHGADVVLYENTPEITDVVKAFCSEKDCCLHIAYHARIRALEETLDGQTFVLDDKKTLRLALLGSYQLRNVSTVLTVIDVLRSRGFEIPEEAVEQGLARVMWPARFEVLRRSPLFLLDGGHNPQCAEALAESLSRIRETSGRRMTFLFGTLSDKDYETIIEILSPHAQEFICVTPDSNRALPAAELADLLREKGFPARACDTTEDAVRTCLAIQERPVVAFGSLYMAGAVRKAFFELSG